MARALLINDKSIHLMNNKNTFDLIANIMNFKIFEFKR